MKNIKVRVEGMMIGQPIPLAEKKMKNFVDANCWISAYNGANLFVKRNGVVRDSTQKEFEEFWTQHIK